MNKKSRRLRTNYHKKEHKSSVVITDNGSRSQSKRTKEKPRGHQSIIRTVILSLKRNFPALDNGIIALDFSRPRRRTCTSNPQILIRGLNQRRGERKLHGKGPEFGERGGGGGLSFSLGCRVGGAEKKGEERRPRSRESEEIKRRRKNVCDGVGGEQGG